MSNRQLFYLYLYIQPRKKIKNMETKARKRKYTDELIFEIINYIHENLQSNSFSYEEMYKKYTTTSATFFSILKKQSIIVKDGSKMFWIADKPDLYMAKSICKIYQESHKIWNESFKEKKQKLEVHKKNLERKESAEKIIKSEELELESSNVYKSVVNEKEHNNFFDGVAIAEKASDALVKAEKLYQSVLAENKKLEEEVSYWVFRATNLNERLKKYESLKNEETVSNELTKGSLSDRTEPKKFIKILGIKFYVNQ